MERRSAGAIFLAACLGASATGCGLILGVSSWTDVSCVEPCTDGAADTSTIQPDVTTDTGQVVTDSTTADIADSGTLDSGTDVLDSGSMTEAEASDPYHPLTATYWSKFDVSTLDASPEGFSGGAFDGRYVYFAPHGSSSPGSLVTRYDTQSDAGSQFALSRAAWQTFDTTTIDGGSGASGFQGAVYDGTHKQLYMVPSNDGVPDGVVAKYSTTGSFTQPSSWSTYAPDVGDGGNVGFAGGVFDGQYVYLVPSNNGVADGIVTRVDTTQPFGNAGAWSAFDLTQKKASAKNYFGAVYTGLLVVFAQAGATSGQIGAYEPAQAFGMPGSWQTEDISGLNALATGFRGAAFDGQYVYLVPNSTHVVARWDSTQQFTAMLAWTFFDATALSASPAQTTGFYGGAFDGRYVYFVPNGGSLVLRYDTTAKFFAATASWATFDTSTLGFGVGPFAGAVFDGEYVYLVPANNGIVVRFDARSPAAPVTGPGQNGGSFF